MKNLVFLKNNPITKNNYSSVIACIRFVRNELTLCMLEIVHNFFSSKVFILNLIFYEPTRAFKKGESRSEPTIMSGLTWAQTV